MRFKTKFDRWIVCLLISLMVFAIAPIAFLVLTGSRSVPLVLVLTPAVLGLYVLANGLPQYYEIRADGLFIRQGWRKRLFPYEAIVRCEATLHAQAGPIFSRDQIVIVTGDGQRMIIAPAEQERFLRELREHCPRLEQKAYGIGMPLSTTSI